MPRDGIQIEGLDEVLSDMETLEPRLLAALEGALRELGADFEDEYRTKKFGGQTANDRLAIRSGGLARSFGHRVTGINRIGGMRLAVGFGVLVEEPDWTWVHEEGATIRPRNAQYLAIPVGDNLTGTGRPRKASPRDLSDPVFIRRSGGSLGREQLLVFDNDALMFVLVRQVEIPARLRLKESAALFFDVMLDPVVNAWLREL